MPVQPNPPFASGAITIPRTLNRWLDKNYLRGSLKRTGTYIIVPSFNVAYTWNGYSDIVASFNFEAPNNFSLSGFLGGTPAQQAPVLNPSNQPFGNQPTLNTPVLPLNELLANISAPNYYLCISWRTVSGKMYRYALWQNVGEILYFNAPPLYSGQLIMKNFRLEVWSTSQGSPAANTNNIYLYTSVLGQVDYRFGTDTQLVTNDGLQTSFSVPGGAGSLLTTTSNICIDQGQGLASSVLVNNDSVFTIGEIVQIIGTTSLGVYGQITVQVNNAGGGRLNFTHLIGYSGDMNGGVINTGANIYQYTGAFALPMVWPAGAVSQPNPDSFTPITITGTSMPAFGSGASITVYNISSTQIVYYVNGGLPNPPNVNLPAIGVDPDGILPGKVWNITTQSWN